jgi:hypothetical protein
VRRCESTWSFLERKSAAFARISGGIARRPNLASARCPRRRSCATTSRTFLECIAGESGPERSLRLQPARLVRVPHRHEKTHERYQFRRGRTGEQPYRKGSCSSCVRKAVCQPRLHCRARQILRSPRTYGKLLNRFDQAHASHHFRHETGVTSNGRRRNWLSMQTLTTDNVAGGESLMRRSSDAK